MWYSDEQYVMIQDSREKKSTAASAYKQRTHCGKGGGVKFPSDYMSAKELKNMNGECISYRMNDPIKWDEFKTWPEEHQKSYIANIRDRYKVPNTALAKAFGIAESTMNRYVNCLGLNQGKETGANGRYWHDSDAAVRFWTWWHGGDISLEETPDLRKPMRFDQFKSLSNEQKIDYITWIRDYFGAPDKWIADTLFRVCSVTLRKVLKDIDLDSGKEHSGRGVKNWNKESFIAWCDQIKKKPIEGPTVEVETTADGWSVSFADEVEEMVMPEIGEDPIVPEVPAKTENPENPGPVAFTGNSIPVIPKSGSMTFENNYVDDILTTVKTLLDAGIRMNTTITWECSFPSEDK